MTAQEIPTGKSSEEVIGAAITAGNAPCLIFNTSPGVGLAVPEAGWPGGARQLRATASRTSRSRTGKAAEQYKSTDGKYYQLPWKANPVMIFYNKKAFAKAGIDTAKPPLSTYDEFLATSTQGGRRQGARSSRSTRRRATSSSSPGSTSTRCSRPRPVASSWSPTASRSSRPRRARRSRNFWRTMYADKLASQEKYTGDSFVDGTAAMADRRPVGDRDVQGQGRVGRRTGADLGRQARGRDLHLQRREERRDVLGLQEPRHRLGRAEVRHQQGAGRQVAGGDRPDAAAQ